ncbi:hypothetical protein vseg_002238 [Gypsophila vaccaria]
MEEFKKKNKTNGGILKKTWERCKSFSHGQHQGSQRGVAGSLIPTSPPKILENKQGMVKSKSWSTLFPTTPTATTPRSGKWAGSKKVGGVGVATPKGFMSVYVGAERERFVVKVKRTNHPLFKMLLEEAETEYGYNSQGPLVLPCDVDVFIKVLYEIDADRDDQKVAQQSCSPIIMPRTSSYHHLSPSHRASFMDLNYNHFFH